MSDDAAKPREVAEEKKEEGRKEGIANEKKYYAFTRTHVSHSGSLGLYFAPFSALASVLGDNNSAFLSPEA